jgi:hypothetical protein
MPSPEWTRLKREITRRLREPTGRVIFVVYFFAIVIMLGGMGWIIPLCRFYFLQDFAVIDELPGAYATFFLASIAGAMADLVLRGNSANGEGSVNEGRENYGFRIFAFGLSLVGILLAFASLQRAAPMWAYVASVLGLMMSLVLWWLLNADSGKWTDATQDPTPPLGGSPTADLQGSTQGLTT